MPTTLDKRLRIPLYYQLKMILLKDIQTGRWKADDRLPTESELEQTYQVSKITVRQALRELADSGYVRREQGRGTFVARRRLEQGPRALSSFTEEMGRHGLHPGSRVLETGVLPADSVAAEKLAIPCGTSVFLLKRLRLAEGEPVGIQTAYIPLQLAPGLPKERMENASLYELLRSKYGREPAYAHETHSAVLVDAEQAKLLGVRPGSPALAAERITYLEDGHPLEFVTAIMRGDRYRIMLELIKERR
ncbi:MAG TPA: GntR family transcriptional regulator [Verrucomicrobiae bacterium]|nr:GntR family transcriptional regulator [Verrucomicrobiae bacterium]